MQCLSEELHLLFKLNILGRPPSLACAGHLNFVVEYHDVLVDSPEYAAFSAVLLSH